jgi:hypothetical protein
MCVWHRELIALSQWGNEFLYEPGEARSVMVDVKDRQPIQKLQLVSTDGRRLQPEDIVTKLGVPH